MPTENEKVQSQISQLFLQMKGETLADSPIGEEESVEVEGDSQDFNLKAKTSESVVSDLFNRLKFGPSTSDLVRPPQAPPEQQQQVTPPTHPIINLNADTVIKSFGYPSSKQAEIQEILSILTPLAEESGFDLTTLAALSKIESDYANVGNKRSSAVGPMQVTRTALLDLALKRVNPNLKLKTDAQKDEAIRLLEEKMGWDLDTLEDRLDASVEYLKLLRDHYKLSGDELIAGYFAGPGYVKEHSITGEVQADQISNHEYVQRYHSALTALDKSLKDYRESVALAAPAVPATTTSTQTPPSEDINPPTDESTELFGPPPPPPTAPDKRAPKNWWEAIKAVGANALEAATFNLLDFEIDDEVELHPWIEEGSQALGEISRMGVVALGSQAAIGGVLALPWVTRALGAGGRYVAPLVAKSPKLAKIYNAGKPLLNNAVRDTAEAIVFTKTENAFLPEEREHDLTLNIAQFVGGGAGFRAVSKIQNRLGNKLHPVLRTIINYTGDTVGSSLGVLGVTGDIQSAEENAFALDTFAIGAAHVIGTAMGLRKLNATQEGVQALTEANERLENFRENPTQGNADAVFEKLNEAVEASLPEGAENDPNFGEKVVKDTVNKVVEEAKKLNDLKESQPIEEQVKQREEEESGRAPTPEPVTEEVPRGAEPEPSESPTPTPVEAVETPEAARTPEPEGPQPTPTPVEATPEGTRREPEPAGPQPTPVRVEETPERGETPEPAGPQPTPVRVETPEGTGRQPEPEGPQPTPTPVEASPEGRGREPEPEGPQPTPTPVEVARRERGETPEPQPTPTPQPVDTPTPETPTPEVVPSPGKAVERAKILAQTPPPVKTIKDLMTTRSVSRGNNGTVYIKFDGEVDALLYDYARNLRIKKAGDFRLKASERIIRDTLDLPKDADIDKIALEFHKEVRKKVEEVPAEGTLNIPKIKEKTPPPPPDPETVPPHEEPAAMRAAEEAGITRTPEAESAARKVPPAEDEAAAAREPERTPETPARAPRRPFRPEADPRILEPSLRPDTEQATAPEAPEVVPEPISDRSTEDASRLFQRALEDIEKISGPVSPEELKRLREEYRPSKGFSINTTRYESSGEALDTLKKFADSVKDTSVQTHAEVLTEAKKMASDLGLVRGQAKQLARALASAPETVTAYRGLVMAQTADVRAMAEEIKRNKAEQNNPVLLAKFVQARELAASLTGDLTNLWTGVARTLSSGRIRVSEDMVDISKLILGEESPAAPTTPEAPTPSRKSRKGGSRKGRKPSTSTPNKTPSERPKSDKAPSERPARGERTETTTPSERERVPREGRRGGGGGGGGRRGKTPGEIINEVLAENDRQARREERQRRRQQARGERPPRERTPREGGQRPARERRTPTIEELLDISEITPEDYNTNPEARRKVDAIIEAAGGANKIREAAERIAAGEDLADINEKIRETSVGNPWIRVLNESLQTSALSPRSATRNVFSQIVHAISYNSFNFGSATVNLLRGSGRSGMTYREAVKRLTGDVVGLWNGIFSPIVGIKDVLGNTHFEQRPGFLRLMSTLLTDPKKLDEAIRAATITPRAAVEGGAFVPRFSSEFIRQNTRIGKTIDKMPLRDILWGAIDYFGSLHRIAGFGLQELADRPFTHAGYLSELKGNIESMRLNGQNVEGLYDQVLAYRKLKLLTPSIENKVLRSGLKGEERAALRDQLVEEATGGILKGLGAEKLKIIETLDQAATTNAEHMTFKDEIRTQALKKFEDFLNSSPIVRPLVLFYHTPVRIVEEATKFGLPFVSKTWLADVSGKNGVKAQNTAIARLAIAGGIYYWTWGMAASGNITPVAATDEERRRLAEAGTPEGSIKIGDKWYDYTGIPMLSFLLNGAATAYRIAARSDDQTALEIGASLLLSIAQNTLNMPWLISMNNAIEALERGDVSAVVSNYTDIATPFSGVRRYLRNSPMGGLNPFYKDYLEDFATKLEDYDTPYPALDSFGKIRRPYEYALGAVRTTEASDSKARQQGVILGFSFTPPGDTVEGVKLTPELHWKLKRIMETELHAEDKINKLIDSRAYQRAEPDQRRLLLDELWTDLRNAARKLIQRDPEYRRLRQESLKNSLKNPQEGSITGFSPELFD